MDGAGIIVDITTHRNPVFIPYERMVKITVKENKDLMITIGGVHSRAFRRSEVHHSRALGMIIADDSTLTLSVWFPAGSKEQKDLIKHLNGEAKDHEYGDTWY